MRVFIIALFCCFSFLCKGQTDEQKFKECKYRAVRGNAVAQCNLGLCYKEGIGVKKNFRRAFYWYRRSALQGESHALLSLGILYELGRGVARDLESAFYCYNKSAKQGNTNAKEILTSMLSIKYLEDEIKLQFRLWLRKRKLETKNEYAYRVSPENRRYKLKILRKELSTMHKELYKKFISKNFILKTYNIKKETFELKLGDKLFYLAVPLNDSKDFKANFDKVYFGDFDIVLNSNKKYEVKNFSAEFGRKKYFLEKLIK